MTLLRGRSCRDFGVLIYEGGASSRLPGPFKSKEGRCHRLTIGPLESTRPSIFFFIFRWPKKKPFKHTFCKFWDG